MQLGIPTSLALGFVGMLPEQLNAMMPMIIEAMEGKEVHVDHSVLPSERLLAGSYNPNTLDFQSAYTYNAGKKAWEYQGFADAPKGSIAVIPVQGALTRNDYCGWFGTMSIAKIFDDARLSANIEGVLQDANSPGGETYGMQTCAEAVAKCNSVKPVVAHIQEGYAASAGYWAICNAEKIFLTKKADQLGSIGVYGRIIIPNANAEEKDYKVVTIYSRKSKRKNAELRQLIESNGENKELFEKRLDFIDDLFMADVKAGRGEKLNSEALEGDMYFAEDAISMGLCDGMLAREEALQEILNLSGSSQSFI
jgi:protease-4